MSQTASYPDETTINQLQAEYEQALKERREWCKEAIGHTEQEVRDAISLGCTLRVVARDGVPVVVTRDMNYDRVNIAVTNGIVTNCYLG